MEKIRVKRFKLIVLLVLMLFLFSNSLIIGARARRTVVYGKGCYSCFLDYVDELKAALEEVGIKDVEVYYREHDRELHELRESLNVPPDMQGYVTVSIDGRFLFEDYVPVAVIKDFVANHMQEYESVVVFFNVLKGSYKIILDHGAVKDCEIEASISECVEPGEPESGGSIFTLLVVSGFLDGINPCAFSVLLFFIALLFSAETTTSPRNVRRRVMLIGAVYIGSVFLAYLIIGLAIFNIIAVTSFPHLVARAGALLMVILGLINVKDYFWRGRGFSLRMPTSGWETIRAWMRRLTIPATFVAGLMVGIFEFPCTGSIYLAITGLLASKSTFLEGFAYLILYNLAFVSPLIAILALAVNKRMISFSLKTWQRKGEKPLKLISGLVYMILGITLLFSGFI